MTNDNLPIREVRSQFVQALASHQVIVVAASTGCGKTTQLPQFLMTSGIPGGGIACTQPRRIAAIAAAYRVAEECGTQIGDEVGYRVRFDNQTSRNTKLTFMTAGILLREAIVDPFLSRYNCVMVDEAHERDVFSDFLLGYLKRVCANRPEFRIVVSSATMRHEEFLSYFENSCLISVEARAFGVDVAYDPVEKQDFTSRIEYHIQEIYSLREKFGDARDVLVFLPGELDIKRVLERLQKLPLEKVKYLPLFGRLAPHEQRKIFVPYDGMKVILATNVAESSLTIDGITYVIDTGLAKAQGFDSTFGVETLRIGKISKAEAAQRAGRAGRTRPGTCIRLYGEEDFLARPEYPTPDICHVDLTELVFAMKSLGLQQDFDFVTRPSSASWDAAEKKLQRFGAIGEDGGVTPYGESMLRLPIDPQLAHFILGAFHYGCIEEAVIMSAMLSIGRFFVSDLYDRFEIEQAKKKFRDPESDFFTLLNLWDDYQASGYSEAWCEDNHLNPYWMRGIRTIRDQLRDVLQKNHIQLTSSRSRDAISRAIFAGLRGNLLYYNANTGYNTASGLSRVAISRDSTAAKVRLDYAVCHSFLSTAHTYAHCIHPVPGEWVAADGIPAPALEAEDEAVILPEDSLIGDFLKKPISELGLSDMVQMKLLGIDVATIGDLISRSEKKLAKEISDLLGAQSGEGVVREVKDRLRYFDLELAPEKKKRGFEFDSKVMNLPPATPLDDEQAANILGEQFPLFQKFRLAAQEYHAAVGANGTREKMYDARNAIAVSNVGLARKRAQLSVPQMQRLDDPSIDFDDLYQEGCIGLLTAVERFDYTRGYRFSTYAFQWVRQAVGRFLDDSSGVPVHMVEKLKKIGRSRKEAADKLGHDPNREELAEFLGETVEEIERLLTVQAFWIHATSIDEPFAGHGPNKRGDEDATLADYLRAPDDDQLENIQRRQLQEMVAGIFEEVPFLEAEQQCLEMYFGLNGNRPFTLEEIGQYLGVTRERVRQRLEESLKRLRTPRIWEMARKHITSLPAPPTSAKPKFETAIGETADEIAQVRVAQEASQREPSAETDIEELRWNAMRIIVVVAGHYGVSSQDIFGGRQTANLVRARKVATYRLREELKMSFVQIGQIFNCDHKKVAADYREIASEVLSGIIPLGLFPADPDTAPRPPDRELPPAPSTSKQVSTNDVLDQDIEVLGLWPKVEQILRVKRKAKTLRNLQDVGRDRLLMTSGLDDDDVAEIEAALVKQGIVLAE